MQTPLLQDLGVGGAEGDAGAVLAGGGGPGRVQGVRQPSLGVHTLLGVTWDMELNELSRNVHCLLLKIFVNTSIPIAGGHI